MGLPASLLGWLNLLAYFWAFLAYLVAAIAGIRALHRAYAGAPAAPFCLIVDATRWVFHREMSSRAWKPRDFVALGVFGTVAACLIAALTSLDFLMEFSWRKLGRATSLQHVADDILTGSALIILHCGIALRFKTEKV
jgi:hypothetical protein